jgi:hypothetical protein
MARPILYKKYSGSQNLLMFEGLKIKYDMFIETKAYIIQLFISLTCLKKKNHWLKINFMLIFH